MKSRSLTQRHRISSMLVVSLVLGWPAWVWPQSITATVNLPFGGGGGLAINSMTDKIYVGGSPVNIVDGKTNVVMAAVAAVVAASTYLPWLRFSVPWLLAWEEPEEAAAT